jgi:hypothetical protein
MKKTKSNDFTPLKKFLKNKIFTGILSALAVAIFGFILLNLTFLLDFAFQSLVKPLLRLPQTPSEGGPGLFIFPIHHILFAVFICLISWPIFKSKLRSIFKAIYLTVPTAVILATIGICFNQWPILVYVIGTLICAGTLYYFYRTKQPWIYYYAVILVALTMSIYTLTGGDI